MRGGKFTERGSVTEEGTEDCPRHGCDEEGVCGARNREVSIGLKECMDITNGRREVGNFKG